MAATATAAAGPHELFAFDNTRLTTVDDVVRALAQKAVVTHADPSYLLPVSSMKTWLSDVKPLRELVARLHDEARRRPSDDTDTLFKTTCLVGDADGLNSLKKQTSRESVRANNDALFRAAVLLGSLDSARWLVREYAITVDDCTCLDYGVLAVVARCGTPEMAKWLVGDFGAHRVKPVHEWFVSECEGYCTPKSALHMQRSWWSADCAANTARNVMLLAAVCGSNGPVIDELLRIFTCENYSWQSTAQWLVKTACKRELHAIAEKLAAQFHVPLLARWFR